MAMPPPKADPSAAPAPQAPGGPEGSDAADQTESQDNGVVKLIQNLNTGLGMLHEIVAESGQQPEVANGLAKITEMFSQVVDQMVNGSKAGGASPLQPGQGSPAPMESGGNAGAVPSSPAQR